MLGSAFLVRACLQPADYYHTTADRYRKLLAETTTPRLTRYLGEMIARCERLARETEAV
jgi:hypothetical protein